MRLLRWLTIAVVLLAAAAAQAVTLDITSQFAVTRSGLILNRSTNTFDSTVKLTNTSGAPVLAPITAVVAGLPAGVTLANKAGLTPDGKPYLLPLAPGTLLPNGGQLTFLLKFANPARVSFTSVVQVLYAVEVPPDAPSLIAVLATGASSALLVGRVDGASQQSVALQATAASTCVAGTLVGGAPVGVPLAATTDAAGYFGVPVAGVQPGAFVTVQLTSPRTSPASLCQVNSRDNDSWPKAFPLDGATATASDFIDAPGKARWYKFAITPGQRIEVKLTGLPADYDLAVFKDIGQVFLNQFQPGAGARSSDLLKLTAEYAPSVFSPSVFSPSVFSPSVFSPSVFSPSVFSPSVFSPSVFSPSVFSPSVFSPSVFSPSVFSPSVFSPSVFSPSVFSPSVFSPTEIAQAFSTAQSRSIVAVGAAPGTASESVVVNTWNNTGSFYVRVIGRDAAFNTSTPFTVSVAKGTTTCAAVTDTTLGKRPPVAASGLKTVFLTDSSKVALDADLTGSSGGTLRAKLAEFAARADVSGVIVDVAGDPRVTALKQQAANSPACPFAKNLVAEEIRGIVDSYRANPLRYVVIVGNDDAIPFFRSPDQSGLGQESGYVPPVQSNSASEASLRRDFVLSQDAYGSTTRIALPATDFPVPGLAVGRLVESATEIAGIIDAFVAANGIVVPRTSLVTGYDFLADAADAVSTELGSGTGTTPDTLITANGKSPQDPASWSAPQLSAKLFGSRHDVMFLAGHFSANSALAADFTTSLLTTDLAASTVDLANAVVFSAGCHSGYNLVDGDGIPGVTLPLDWAQAFARKKATLIAGTGYQYGDTDFLEYSERLYRNFARQLRAGAGAVSVGEALVKAKLDYLASTPDIRGIHEKALLQTTLFGLPMLGVNMPAGRGAAPGTNGVINPAAVASGTPAATLELRIHDLNVNLTAPPGLVLQTKPLRNLNGGPDVLATWLTGPDGVVSKPGEPTLPLATINVTPTDAGIVLRGIGFRGGAYVDSAPLLPFSGAPTTELRGVHVPFVSPVFFPGRMWSANYFGALAGSGGTQLLVTPVQHRVANVLEGTSTQRRYNGLDLRLYYSGNLSQAALSDAPSIVGVEARPDAGGVLFTVQVVGDPAAAVHQVWVTHTSDGAGAWTSLDLVQCAAPLPAVCGGTGDSRLWKGRLGSSPPNLKYFVQAASGVGLVALDDRLGSYYGVGAATPAATTLVLATPPGGATIGDSVDVTAKLTFTGTALAGKPVIIALGGIAKVGMTSSDGSVTVKLPVAAIPGNYLFTASFAGDDTFLPSSSTASFAVGKAASNLAGLAPTGATLSGTFAGQTKALQQESVSFAVNGPTGPATIWAITDYLGRATLPPPGLAPGNYTVTQATFGGNATYAATSVALSQLFNVSKTAQIISFAALAGLPFGTAAFPVYATASSGLPVLFQASGACGIAGNLVQTNGIGSCTITATQPGDAFYAAAPPLPRTFAVSKATQAITFAPAPTGVTVGQPLVTVTATSSNPAGPPSTLPIVFNSTTPAVCAVGAGPNSAIVTPLAVGVCTIAANQLGDGAYDPAAQATLSFPVAAAGVPPATFTVTNLNDSGGGSLRRAVNNANTAPGPNIVDFAPGLTGIIHLTSGSIVISGPLQIVGPGTANMTIDGGALDRIFAIGATFPACPTPGLPLTLDGPDYLVSISGLRLTNGHRNVAGSCGGAIYTEHSLALDSMDIDHNIARCAGGILFSTQYPGQTLNIFNSRFLNNTATELLPPPNSFDASGGALYVVEKCQNALDTPYTKPVAVTIANSEFRGNSAQPLTDRDGRGGAIRSYSRADILIADTIITGNDVDAPNPPVAGFVYRGGGIEGTAKSLRIERSEIAENGVNDVTLGNVARGGGLHIYNTSVDLQAPADTMAVKIVNSTISGNFASASGGGLSASGNLALELVSSTVSDNLAAPSGTGGVLLTRGATYPALGANTARPTLTLVSSILANNSSLGGDVAVGGGNLAAGFTVNAFNSLIETPCPSPNCVLFMSGTGSLFGVDPLLGPLAANGGPTRTHALQAGSPAIGTGSNPLGLSTDQRGSGFPRANGAAADMGAYESPY